MSVATARKRAKSKTKQPTYSDQIAVLVEKKQSIASKKDAAETTVRGFQQNIDDAEVVLTDAFVQNLAHRSEENTLAESNARIARDALVKQRLVAEENLKMIPKSIDILNQEIRALTVKRDVATRELVDSKQTQDQVDGLKDKAAKALAAYGAALVMLRTRQIGYSNAQAILKTFSKERTLDAMMVEEYYKLERKLGIDQL